MSLPVVVAVTGASGAIYGLRLIDLLIKNGVEVHLTISPSGKLVIEQELGRTVDLDNFDIGTLLPGEVPTNYVYHNYKDFMTPIASGSFRTRAMVVVPCSGSSVAAIAGGTSNNLIHRAADVHLKEGRKLILVTRETPLSKIHLQNMLTATDAGATILPASPGWYHGVQSIDDLVDFVVSRILDQLEFDNRLMKRWGVEDDRPPRAGEPSTLLGDPQAGSVPQASVDPESPTEPISGQQSDRGQNP